MSNLPSFSLWFLVPIFLLASILFYQQVFRLFGVVFIGQDENGIVNKKWVLFGNNKSLRNGQLIALNGEAGWQADMLPPGIHYLYWPWQYEIKRQKVIEVPELALVIARDGAALNAGRVLAQKVNCNMFQDARAFLLNGGQRGKQIGFIPPGSYRINTELFELKGANVLEIDDAHIGIVTTKDGAPLDPATGDIAGPIVKNHDHFQDGEGFISAGGKRGLQEQVLQAGRYFINGWFATVEMKELSTVPIASAGVIVSYVGEVGEDMSGADFKHGNLVGDGKRGVWRKPLDPGKYPINPFTHRIEAVSTANIVLNWADAKTEAHKLDSHLSTIALRSKDGFAFNLDVSQIIHIPASDAPLVIARFGSVQNLVSQVLEPTIGNYFRRAAQDSDVIAFLQERGKRQDEAKEAIAAALKLYNVEAVDTLIGDINPPASLMKTLTDRKQAFLEKETFSVQMEAEESRKALQQAKAVADTQPRVVQAEREAEIAKFNKAAAITAAEGAADARKITATGNAEAVSVEGAAEAGKVLAIGKAEAEVVKLKILSVESGNYAAIEVAKYLSQSKQPIVPAMMFGGNGKDEGNMASMLLASLLAKDLGNGASVFAPRREEVVVKAS